jgi:hypothetical protein
MKNSIELEVITTESLKYRFYRVAEYDTFIKFLNLLPQNREHLDLYEEYLDSIDISHSAEKAFQSVAFDFVKGMRDKRELKESLESRDDIGLEVGTDFSLFPFKKTKLIFISYDNSSGMETRREVEVDPEVNRELFIIINSSEKKVELNETMFVERLLRESNSVINGSKLSLDDKKFNGFFSEERFSVDYSPSFYMVTDDKFDEKELKIALFEVNRAYYLLDIFYKGKSFGLSRVEMSEENSLSYSLKSFDRGEKHTP